MEEEIVSGSQTETTPAPEVDSKQAEIDAAFAAFGLEKPTEGQTVTPSNETPENGAESVTTDAPAIEQPTPKTIKVKHNKEEIEVDVSDDKLPEYVQKALALDKERERKSEYERELDEAVILLGFKDRADYLANKDSLRKQREQKQQTEFDQLKQQMIQQYEDAGYDPAQLQTWLDNNPVLQKAQEVLQRDQETQKAQERAKKFDALYTAFPELKTQIKEDGSAEWYTPQMHELVEAGTPPLIAYKALNAENIAERKAKSAEQKAIKDMQLGRRSQVESPNTSSNDSVIPADVLATFKAFGMTEAEAKQQYALQQKSKK